MKCKYWDCGFCYAPDDVVTSASSQGACFDYDFCPYLKTEMTDKQPEVMSSGTAIISDENGVPTKVHLSDKEKLTEMTETHDLRNQWYDEPVQYETSEKVIEDIEAQIKMLQSKLEFYKELEKTKSPVEEAYKDWYGAYPTDGIAVDNSWDAFQAGYNAAQKDYKVGEYQETSQELKTLYQMLDGKYCPDACVFICDIVKEWMYQYDCDYATCSSEYLEGYEECQTVLEERMK
jgi:hypothetical protein